VGTWGTGIFSDDEAADIRDAYRDFVGEGLTGAEATRRLLTESADSLNDPDVGPVFWLALAATQLRVGRLEQSVKERAIEVIDSGVDLRRWSDDPKLARRRQAVLVKLRARLQGPPRPPTRIRKP
jgi:hypothetical protein